MEDFIEMPPTTFIWLAITLKVHYQGTGKSLRIGKADAECDTQRIKEMVDKPWMQMKAGVTNKTKQQVKKGKLVKLSRDQYV